MRHLEDFHVGDVYELGSRLVTEEEIVQFARLYDPQPRHLRPTGDGRGGKRGGERHGERDGIIASGWHVAAILMRLYVDAVLRDSAVELSPGVDELRWLHPVRPGDVLSGRVTVIGASPSLSRPDCGILQQRGELADRDHRLVMRATLYGLMRKRSAPTGSIW